MNEEPKIDQTIMRAAFYTLGCRLNIAETGAMTQGFAERGFEIVPFGEETDFVVINTCTVTNKADSECRNTIRKAHRTSPNAKIIVVGCYAQLESAAISEIEGVELVLGTSEKHKLFKYLDDLGGAERSKIHVEESDEFYFAATQESDSHTRAFLKIQDGCNYFCSYCIIPFARGRARSIRVQDAVNQAKDLVSKGYKEIVLTGINIGEFSGTNGERFEDLVSGILQIDGMERLRMSSIEPNTVTDELFELLGHPKMMPHFHLPVQVGDETILKMMRRRYDLQQYRALIEKIHHRYPYAAIGSDVIVGFPGETDELFENTRQFLASLPLTHYHVFPYSVRKGTKAERLEGHLTGDIKKERVKVLNQLGDKKIQEFAQQFVGQKMDVLFETRNSDGRFEGLSPQYIKVVVNSDIDLNNQIKAVRIQKADHGVLYGVCDC